LCSAAFSQCVNRLRKAVTLLTSVGAFMDEIHFSHLFLVQINMHASLNCCVYSMFSGLAVFIYLCMYYLCLFFKCWVFEDYLPRTSKAKQVFFSFFLFFAFFLF
jgi:hypothetical protein